ncbi:methionine ABC transporter ATP-binding protein [Suttonella ornithocola]|uniref:Cell division ATP-binding protein FtsE n=1 Tax=Suttonella ornithocola TaxID=279832 RepID=A0A380MVT9_9GAMM|nr:methionine ABC transporter ATP-binding protein [Suttonella ornithocola]SUO96402.1 Methionine import ATP-binding protein MetN [Suttonella ornithocola]
MITLNNISKTFQQGGRTVTALNNITLNVAAGEIYGVVGESGAGKSTLIRCVNLLERPSQGEVIVDGQDLTKLSTAALFKARHNIGMIFQHFNLLSGRTVAENIALPLELIGASKAHIREKVQNLIDLTGLSEKANYFPSQLSGGQKQRVAIARALASESKVLLSDEATSALDPKTTDAILSLLKEINQKLGVTILLITHEMEVVKKICDKVALLDRGELVENNTVEGFFTAPQSELGKHFVEQIQKFDLPESYSQRLRPNGDYPVLKLLFQGAAVDEPVLSSLARQFDVNVSIIQAKVEHIATITAGFMIAELIGEKEKISRALNWLHSQPLKTEILGYVSAND